MARAKDHLITAVTSIWYRNSDKIGVEIAVWGIIILLIVGIIVLCYLRFNDICCCYCRYYKKRSREKTEYVRYFRRNFQIILLIVFRFRTRNDSLKSTETKTSYENIPLVP